VISHPSQDPLELWSAGWKLSSTPWQLFLHANEVVTGQLRHAIEEKIALDPGSPTAFALPHITVFLQKRLKYPLHRISETASVLAWLPTREHWQPPAQLPHGAWLAGGSLINYGDDTLREACACACERGEQFADRLHETGALPTVPRLLANAVKSCGRSFASILGKQKGFKEGFEGLAFAGTELGTLIYGHLRYYEKYIRTGRNIVANSNAPHRILVIKLRDIGDCILATPLLNSIKRCLPYADVSVLTYTYSQPIFANNPHVDRLYTISKSPDAGEIDSLVAELNRRDFDLVMNLHSGGFSSGLLARIRARGRMNNHYVGRDREGDIRVPESDYYRSAVERDLDCLRALGLEPDCKKTELFLTKEEIDWARDYLARRGLDRRQPLIIVHPTASVEIREWGMERFGSLIEKLKTRFDQVAVVCTEAEFPRVRVLEPSKPIFIHDVSLRQLTALIRESALVIDNDSAPSHIAAAFGVPALVLFSQAIREIFRPYDASADKHRVLYRDVPCRECGLNICDHKICLDFTVDEVYARAVEILEAFAP
jgi:ADP-heptose:LPS heptosyltransferase